MAQIEAPRRDDYIDPKKFAQTSANADVWIGIFKLKAEHPELKMTTGVIQEIFDQSSYRELPNRTVETRVAPQKIIVQPNGLNGTVFTAAEVENLLAFKERLTAKTVPSIVKHS